MSFIQMTSLVVTLDGHPPWGFRLSGGKEFRRPLTISKVNVSSSAEQANLRPGDVILEINGEKATGMLHMEAHDSIKYCSHKPTLLIYRPRSILSRASPVKSENQSYQEQKQVALKTLTKVLETRSMETGTSKEYHYPNDATKKLLPSSFSPVGKTNEPFFVKSNSCDVPKKKYPLPEFDVCQKIPWSRGMTTAPRQSNTFHVLQEALEAACHTKSALGACGRLQPNPKRQFNTLFRGQRFRTCETCGTPIVTQAVRIREGRVRHQECYCCNDCGLSLLRRGHFCVGEELFCGKHAQQRYQKTR